MAEEQPIVTVKQGQLRGRKVTGARGTDYYSFQNIPYAKPSLGELRFKAPQPPEPWQGVRDATVEGPECYSKHMIFLNTVGDEDCLILNVFTPQLPSQAKALRPVMVYIHGGGFTAGSSKTEFYGPDFLLTEDVVVVSINYRLGVLGFLSLEDPELGVPGNAGLKDMVMSLRWVQENVVQFNGDPNNVTIFGESAGGAAVHLLMLSPMAKGLFHKAIAQSGSALNPWAIGIRCVISLAKFLKFETDSEEKALKFLREQPVDDILKAQLSIKDPFEPCEIRPVGPVVEKVTSKEPAFLSEDAMNLLQTGNYNKVPFMTGFTSREGMLFDIINLRRQQPALMTDFERAVPYALNVKRGSPLHKTIAGKIKEFYYGNETPNRTTNLDAYYLLNSDIFFVHGIITAIKKQVATSNTPIYLYRISVETDLNLYRRLGNITSKGVCHADDLGYLFKMDYTPEIEPGTLADISVKRMIKLWTNFARTGNPNGIKKDELLEVEWKPVDKEQLNFLDIGEKLTQGVNPEHERMLFWDNIVEIAANSSSKM